jgi:hypothetical protein
MIPTRLAARPGLAAANSRGNITHKTIRSFKRPVLDRVKFNNLIIRVSVENIAIVISLVALNLQKSINFVG